MMLLVGVISIVLFFFCNGIFILIDCFFLSRVVEVCNGISFVLNLLFLIIVDIDLISSGVF